MNAAVQRAYAAMPVPLQNAALSAWAYGWQRRRFGGVFERELRGFKERESFTSLHWRDYQTVQLRRLLVHAYETVPYYRRTFTAAGFGKAALQRFELEDLQWLPFVEKDDLRRFGRTELVSTKREPHGEFFPSSGSTGTPTSILYSHGFHQRWSAAFEARIRHWAGVDRHTPRGMIGGRRILPDAVGRPPFYRYNAIEKQTYFSAFHISRANAPNYLEGIRRHGVRYMTGYAASNYFLAAFLRDLGLEAPQLDAVVTSSEKLTPEMRETFRAVYGCRTFDGWSGIEACGLITENEAGELMGSPDVGILELLDEQGREVGAGETGELVCTGLLNFDQPLIRYRIGDLATRAATQRSQTGRVMPMFAEIVGRIEDRVVGPDGRITSRFHPVFLDIEHLRAAQIVQEAIDRIVVRVVTEPGFGEAQEQRISERIRSQVGEVDVAFEHVPELERNANGKIQAVVSLIGHAA